MLDRYESQLAHALGQPHTSGEPPQPRENPLWHAQQRQSDSQSVYGGPQFPLPNLSFLGLHDSNTVTPYPSHFLLAKSEHGRQIDPLPPVSAWNSQVPIRFGTGPLANLDGRYPLTGPETPPPPYPPSHARPHRLSDSLGLASPPHFESRVTAAGPDSFDVPVGNDAYPVMQPVPESAADLDTPPPLMYRCTSCPRTFLSSHGFRVHQRTHEAPRPYKCPITSCGRTFTTRPNGIRHLGSHGREGEGLHILRLSGTVRVSSSAAATSMALPKLPPPPRIEPLPPASLLVPCISITRSSCYPLLAPPPGAFTAPCPLPPVKPGPGEERNSWDPPPTDEPYHPSGWSYRAVLPGPRLVFASISQAPSPTDVI